MRGGISITNWRNASISFQPTKHIADSTTLVDATLLRSLALLATEEFLTALRTGLTRCHVKDAYVLVGVSGGADSVALLRGLCQLRKDFSLSLRVAHLNHKLRGAASDADAEWVRMLAVSLQLPVEIGEVTRDLTHERGGLEEAAREARHRFLNDTAARLEFNTIALAHTADDQIETVLHHLFRGTGLSGLRGIPHERLLTDNIRLVRPIRSIHRELVETYLSELGQDYRTDATNADTALTRNWLRHDLLPKLRSRFGEKVDLSLTRLSDQAAEIESTLTTLAERLLDAALLDLQPRTVRVNTRSLTGEPRHLVREVFVQLWRRQAWPRQAMNHAHWNRLADLVGSLGATSLPGEIEATHRTTGLLVIARR